jgi:predicted transcriptional regulator
MIKKFVEVRCDYREPETNKYYIDGWESDDDDAEGMTLATVDEDGVVEWLKGFSIGWEVNKETIHSNVFEAIEEAREKQKEHKQELIDKCLEQIKGDVESGDVTAIDELLMFLPIKYLKGYTLEE